jgi:hypothetical protein
MTVDEVLLVGKPPDHWEVNLIRGALWHHGMSSRAVTASQARERGSNQLIVFLDAMDGDRGHFDAQALFAGRQLTYAYLAGQFLPGSEHIMVYGEPFAFLARVAEAPQILDDMRGAAVLGPLFDPREYAHPPAAEGAEPIVRLMTSIGCVRKCGYCPHGVNYAQLYGSAFGRRERPWQKVAAELEELGAAGNRQFCFLADQFLSRTPERNRELNELASHWNAPFRPTVGFTVAPPEVISNTALLEQMSKAFDLVPVLSIDSLCESTLSRWNMDFGASEALEAVNVFRRLALPLRINYIFFRPGVSRSSLERELEKLRCLASALSYLPPRQQLLIGLDLFSVQLQPVLGAPAAGVGVRDYDEETIKLFSHVTSCIQAALNAATNELRSAPGLACTGQDANLLSELVEAAHAGWVRCQ